MPLNFLTPRVERLRADGAFEAVHEGGLLGRLRRPVVLLARDLCTFSLFEAGALPKGRRRQAARLHARVGSPYVAGGAALVKCGDDFGVWWWDLERITPLVEARHGGLRPPLRPESLAQPPARDWRIVRLAQGYEAQLWRGKGLAASVWRRTRFDGPAWAAFTRLQRGAPPAPVEPPEAESLPIATDSEAFSLSRAEVTREQAIAMGAASFALAVLSTVAFLGAQGLQLRAEAKDIEGEIVEIRQSIPRTPGGQGVELDRRRLAAFRQVEETTNPVSAAGAAIGIVAYHDLTPTALDIDGGVATLTLPYTAMEAADELVAEFEQSGYFHDVQPRTDAANQSLIIEMQVREAAPPLSAVE
jgi:hypothetical protein